MQEGTETEFSHYPAQASFSHQNIAFSSFQLIKGQLDILLLHQSQLCLAEMGHVKGPDPKATFARDKQF